MWKQHADAFDHGTLWLHNDGDDDAAQTPMPWNQLSASLWPSQSPWKSWISPSFVLQKPWSDTKCFDAWLDGAGTLTSSPIQFVAKEHSPDKKIEDPQTHGLRNTEM
ncbi:hypothetical protein NP493_1461g00033 [Ridgeia piscesae]|uniref:Uncharacterized protein n=1 Tax=Ridgeia piscesae TaxID=27915 RepID=A0AAD9NCD7_RIDPI|nr:hypothetical protein NP493_1461g00033 [Ridgeia piscesae]